MNPQLTLRSIDTERLFNTLLDAPDVNAFATDDNYVYVNRGLLNYVQNVKSRAIFELYFMKKPRVLKR